MLFLPKKKTAVALKNTRETLFVNVLLPLPVAGFFTYRVPLELNDSICVGQRVVVQFGKKKIYTALVRAVTQKPPETEPKYILSILDAKPIVNEWQFRFWEWMASYYCCTVGEVMNAALPAALKLASESKIQLNPYADLSAETFSEKQIILIQTLQNQGKITLGEAVRAVEQLKIIPLIQTLIEKGIVTTEEEIEERYRPKIETFVCLSDEYRDEEKLQKLYSELERKALKQLEVLIEYIHLSQWLSEDLRDVSLPALSKRIKSASVPIRALEKKGVFILEERQVSRLTQRQSSSLIEDIRFSEIQQNAFDSIRNQFLEKNVVLLHGVTGSGKTELFIRLIQETLDAGKQVLYLLPEIALTTQIITRLQKYFGSRIGIYHSRYDENERVEIWKNVLPEGSKSNPYQVVLGARSALFLPFENLGLVIVDEEHDSSYKQYDPAPRYNARDSAIYLASLHKAKVLLGSATPSVETYYNAVEDKFGLVSLNERYGGIRLPEINLVDLRQETKRKQMKSIFSQQLLDHIGRSLDAREQVILFQNRRGFSLHIACTNCDWIPQCVHCDVSLVYHKKANHLRCHYCGFTLYVPEKCPDCGYAGIQMHGFGTEKIEEELSIFFPSAQVQRMDLDSTRSKYALQKIISDFEEQKIDILVGTQMVTKGLDFDNVSLVGILNADSLLSYPDFRSYERSFQLMSQVAGRSGRKNKQGNVLIQAYNIHHPVLSCVVNHDYQAMYQTQILERQKFSYPPFHRIVRLTLKHQDADLVNHAAADLAQLLRKSFGKRVLGPEYPLVSRIRNLYLKNILLKFEKGISLPKAKGEMQQCIQALLAPPTYKQVRIVIDVDAM